MGNDVELFIHPDRISSQLICPICTQVLYKPVQTLSDHLFCEDELLEWMSQSNLCPVTQQILDPNSISKPSRIIMNMLGELEMRCPNYNNGCDWIGLYEQLDSHVLKCEMIPNEQLREKLAEKESELNLLREECDLLETDNANLKSANRVLRQKLQDYEKKFRVYDAFLTPNDVVGDDKTNICSESSGQKSPPDRKAEKCRSDIEQVHRLRNLNVDNTLDNNRSNATTFSTTTSQQFNRIHR